MSQPVQEPTIEDYKKYTRELKAKIKRLQEKNKELVEENVGLKNNTSKGGVSSKQNVNFAVSLNNRVIKAQVRKYDKAIWRGILARRNFKRLLQRMSRGEAPKPTPNSNQMVMMKAKQASDRLGLTLEMLFRAADVKSQGTVMLEDFKLFLRNIKFKLSNSQMTRFLFLIDEGCEGVIPRDDYYTTLAAYGVNSEREWAHGSFRTFEQQCLLKFAKVMEMNGMTAETTFRAIDSRHIGKVEPVQIMQFVDQTLRTEFKEREKFALGNYLDINKTGSIDRKHFMTEMEKAKEINQDPNRSRIILDTKDKRSFGDLGKTGATGNIPVTDSLFQSAAVGGDQAVVGPHDPNYTRPNMSQGVNQPYKQPNTMNTVNTRAPGSSAQINIKESDQEKIEAIVKKIERQTPIGRFLFEVLNACEQGQGGTISLEDFNTFLSARYGNVLTPKDRPTLIKAMDQNGNGRIELIELRDFFKMFASRKNAFLEFSLRILASHLDKNMISTSDYLISRRVDLKQRINFDMFCSLMPDLVKLDLKECGVLFREIDSKQEGSKAINAYRTEYFQEFFSNAAKFEHKPTSTATDGRREARDLQGVILKVLNNRKLPLKAFFKILIDNSDDPERGIEMGTVRDSIEVAFIDVLNENERNILKDCLDINKDRILMPQEMLVTLKDAMKDECDKIQLHFEFRASLLDKTNQATEDYLYKHEIYKGRNLDEPNFVSNAMRSLWLSREESIFTFKTLADGSQFVPGDYLVECIESFRKLHPKPTCGPPPIDYPPNQPSGAKQTTGSQLPQTTIKQPDGMNENTRNKVISTVKSALARRKLTAIHLYRTADTDSRESVSVISLKQTYQMFLKDLAPEMVFALMKILDLNKDGFISIDEYQLIMMGDEKDLQDIKDNDSRREYNKSERSHYSQYSQDNASVVSELPTPKNLPNGQPFPQEPPSKVVNPNSQIDAAEPAMVAKNIGKYLTEQMFDPETIFDSLDRDKDSQAPVLSVLKLLNFFIPDEPRAVLQKALKYMDGNRDGFISETDFMLAVAGKPPASHNMNQPLTTKNQNQTSPNDNLTDVNDNFGSPGPNTYDDGEQGAPTFNKDENPANIAKGIGKHLSSNQMEADTIFDMIDTDQLGVIPTMSAIKVLTDFCQGTSRSVISRAAVYMDPNGDGFISKQDFLAALSGKAVARQEAKPVPPNQRPLSSQWPSENPTSESTFYSKVRELKSCLLSQGFSLNALFDSDSVPVLELQQRLSRILPSYPKSSMLEVLKYMDVDGNGNINKGEFELMIGYNEVNGEIEESVVVGYYLPVRREKN